ncbi:MAG: hypothetical protein HYZ50_07895 [Deltaproteobacteria bacterium]|nr:hypothetical protein [Deltaproteobacteria bacterium]
MAAQTQSSTTDVMTLWTAAFLESPAASMKWGWEGGKEQEVTEVAWKGYDAWVRLTSTTINEFYKTPGLSDLAARALDGGLRWQRLSQALVSAAAASLWPAVGLPTAATLQAAHEEVQSLSARMRTQDTRLQALHADLRTLYDAVLTHKRKSPAPITLGAPLPIIPTGRNGHRTVTASATAA